MKRGEKGNRGQMELSFGMIFSIILIIVFIAFAVYAIMKFLDLQRIMQVGAFISDFQNDVDNMWQSSKGSQERIYSLPSKIELVCFIDYSMSANNEKDVYDELIVFYSSKENLFFYPLGSAGDLNGREIEHIDLEKITEKENPFCVQNENGKVKVIIKKDFEDALVKIERNELNIK